MTNRPKRSSEVHEADKTRESAAKSSRTRAAAAGFAGAVMEWYDFFVYGLVAASVFPKLFFAGGDSVAATLLTFATFGVGFLARPIGGIVFGHFGDKIGRKAMLVATVVLMGVTTTLIGLLPTYEQVGSLAPMLLVALRLIQGFALGGEWGGAALIVIEHAPETRRGLFGSVVQLGASVGLLIATGTVALVSAVTTNDQFLTWGWRLPFLASAIVALGGYVIRRSVEESPHFVGVVKVAHGVARVPLFEALVQRPRAFIKIVAMRLAELVTFYTVTVYSLNYGSNTLGLPRSGLLLATLLTACVSLLVVPLAASVSDRIGRRPVFCLGAFIGVIGAFPLFWALESRNLLLIAIAYVWMNNLCASLVVAVQQPLFTEMFDVTSRYSGAGFAYQLASALAGGFTPLIAAWLALQNQGRPTYVALYLLIACLVSLLAALIGISRTAPASSPKLRS